MAFHSWSIPLFCAAAVVSLVIILHSQRGVSKVARIVITVISVAVLTFLCFFGWWVNQGGENYYGHLLFIWDWVALVLVTVVGSVVSLWIGRRRSGK